MAVTWNWDAKVGEAIIEQTFDGIPRRFTVNLYNGNCYLIFIREWEQDDKQMYSMFGFFADKEHMNRCLGLKKNYDNMFNMDYQKLKKLRLSKDCRHLKEIADAFMRAMDEVEIEVYTEKKDDKH